MSPTVSAASPETVARFHDPQAEHCGQVELLAIADPLQRFEDAFECGDELFATRFNMLDGVGANVGNNLRFTRVPRADLAEWMSHFPERPTGPNAEACTVCHIEPFEDGAGAAGVNVVRDPRRRALPAEFIQRNTPHVFAAGALQRLAEEMTQDLHSKMAQARRQSCREGGKVRIQMTTKGVSFGTARIDCRGDDDLSGINGIDDDLIVKPFGWKGDTKTVREFNRTASHNELGMQAVELVGYGHDADGDLIADEFSVGDMSALAIYVAGQPRPATRLELNRLGLLDLTRAEIRSIRRGEEIFGNVGCAECHRPRMVIKEPRFSEPSQVPEFREAFFPAGQAARSEGVDPDDAIGFDLTADQPDNVIEVDGETIRFGTLRKNSKGFAVVNLYGDLKRHYMGEVLAENIDEVGTGAAVWITKELWGVGSTAPYLHDGRATTLTEAIDAHGGDADSARSAAARLSDTDFADMIAFLDNLILFKVEVASEAEGEPDIIIFGDRDSRERRHRDSTRFR